MGQFKEALINGIGIKFFKEGHVHIGEWKEGNRHGKGIFFNKNLHIIENGNWINDVF